MIKNYYEKNVFFLSYTISIIHQNKHQTTNMLQNTKIHKFKSPIFFFYSNYF
ncbi:unnamed protein product [Phytomonas sp. Hart1]|nr:unnamed protein product [Phytomonas sp. Hart1]|eukprot:CCW72208.1 unnamed protein product [Phytomonas sp. isolate Hart1]